MSEDPYKRDRSQDGCNEAEKRPRMTSDKFEGSSSPQRGRQSPQREKRITQRERRSPQRERRSPQRIKEPKHWKDRDSPQSSNSLSSDIMRRLQSAGNLISFQNYV